MLEQEQLEALGHHGRQVVVLLAEPTQARDAVVEEFIAVAQARHQRVDGRAPVHAGVHVRRGRDAQLGVGDDLSRRLAGVALSRRDQPDVAR